MKLRNRDYLLITSIIIIVLLFMVRMSQTMRLITDGIQLGELQTQLEKVTRENKLLREELYWNESLQVIHAKAQSMGFVPATYLILK